MKIHLAIKRTMYGEIRIKSLCGRSRCDVINIDTIDAGQNVTKDVKAVTCSYCLNIIAAHLDKF